MNAVPHPAFADLLPKHEPATEHELRVMLAEIAGACRGTARGLTAMPRVADVLTDYADRAEALLQRHRITQEAEHG